MSTYVVVYETPIYGVHHYSQGTWNQLEQMNVPRKKPKWVYELQQKQNLNDLDSVVLAMNSTGATNKTFKGLVGNKTIYTRNRIIHNVVVHFILHRPSILSLLFEFWITNLDVLNTSKVIQYDLEKYAYPLLSDLILANHSWTEKHQSDSIESPESFSFDEISSPLDVSQKNERTRRNRSNFLVSILHSNFLSMSQLLVPHYQKVVSSASASFVPVLTYGVLTGKRSQKEIETNKFDHGEDWTLRSTCILLKLFSHQNFEMARKQSILMLSIVFLLLLLVDNHAAMSEAPTPQPQPNSSNLPQNVLRDAARDARTQHTRSHAYSSAKNAVQSACACLQELMETSSPALVTTIGRPREEDPNALEF
ncbi:hypothetical protein HS088_TW03G00589 [Tripterygium wilfordii]|uniref:Uncharacterized protein n=1 Tax=Tripterygium wilfordii TaxID=458696 RepID=A0A7J7DV64_TRIWF|nr:hypothetical protein HS088_TW03G00589 [Tripterygium wilfordii]